MSKHLARDDSVWNRLIYGSSRIPVEEVQETTFNEKEEQEPKKRSMNYRIFAIYAWVAVTAVFALYETQKLVSPLKFGPGLVTGRRNVGIGSTAGVFSVQEAPKEIIEVSYPFVPSKRYGESLHTELLANKTFSSWGDPSFVEYTPPEIEFNRVVLTLHTNVTGVQYDRLAHLYVGGAEIWRTSTIEPGGSLVFSIFSKDVSKYLALFKEKNGILFQLDNVVNDNINGEPHVELYADFYNDHSTHGAEFGPVEVDASSNDERYQYFDIRKPADKVYPLIEQKDPKTPPIVTLSGEQHLELKLPQVSRNTTRLQLDVFSSGNGDEEFWYTNVLDKFKSIFAPSELLGHGPLRIVNVYFDGEKIASQTQQPFIFTGGISPSLWSPVVAINAFDLPSINVDVSGLLPLLWEDGEHTISFDISNGLDEANDEHSGVGDGWITGVNLLTYENKDVVKGSGEIIHIGNRTRANSIAFGRKIFLSQIVNGILEGELTSELTLTLANGEEVSTIASSFNKGEISNVQSYLNSGANQKVVHTGHNAKSFLLVNKFDEEDRIHSTNVSLSYPLVLSSNEKSSSNGTDLNISIVYSVATTLDIDDKRVMGSAVGQNGTSIFHQRSDGNYGDANLTTNYKIQVSGPTKDFTYKRRVDAEHGKIVFDHEDFEDGTEDWSQINELISQIASINGTANGPLPELPTNW
ncbi:hypothetical protein FT663_00428 [Candidozyma haemuli var. vulneris]|uniref:Peptide N-acetyl-beta-D-glucosaminyl asparaginase amidase A N-terminal domain-containing protein n=1 Tax=Candidozyma haemuli TaxID=45357 RepID=A0A2V1AS05_9ASCO|nr:hypothetical protein CXQ85_002306 [[Candida] haemuloni]KAF3993405.1 hypothetical protein FT662_00534 [[Candida] haemuloni var. vulneris]KAF3995375.1 hypothetical protein FT663_00428 [[Candida] haemuloni var. vulneris]PVH20514.1 hypothetical protein CXQ85_002306 [[Candida] haemuloni]